MPDRRRKPLTEKQLDELAEITPEDIDRAERRWREIASPEMKDLLDAEPTDADPTA